MELQELINKWNEEIAMHRRVVEDPLMWTKEQRLKSSHQTQAICALLADVKKLSIHNVSDTLIAWQQFRDANWYESEAIDVEKMLMDKFQAIYGR